MRALFLAVILAFAGAAASPARAQDQLPAGLEYLSGINELCASGQAFACWQIGSDLFERRNFDLAADYLVRACPGVMYGNAQVCRDAGEMLLQFPQASRNPSAAVERFVFACDAGNSDFQRDVWEGACLRAAEMLSEGVQSANYDWRVLPDRREARRMAVRGCRFGNAGATCLFYADLLLQGSFDTGDLKRAYEIFRAYCLRGDDEACDRADRILAFPPAR